MRNHILFLVLLSFLSIPVYAYTQSNEVQHMPIILSNKGIDFAKDELIKKAASTMIPLELPDIEKSKKIPLIGRVRFVLSDITVDRVDIESSHVETGEKGLVLVVSGATADLTMNWGYSYKNWVIVISDSGEASVQVEGMQIQLSIALQEQGGNIKATLLDCTCHVDDISIKVDGGASWLYQALVDVFEGSISTAIEQAVTKKLEEGIEKLDSVLQSLPKQLPVDDIATLDITLVENPLLSNSALEFDVDGLFKATADNSLLSSIYCKQTQTSFSCNDAAKMIEISVPEYTFNSAASVYYNAGCMHWMINKLPDQSVLNTASWRYVYPGLYEKYPDDALKLNISVTAPPIIRIMKHGINADIYLDAIVNVLDAGSVIPVACVSLVLSTSGSPHVLRYNLAGTINLEGFTVSLKWSVIGDVNMPLLRPIMLAILKAVYIPYVNIHLMKGFPLPLPHVVLLKNPEIYYSNSKMIICSNMVTS